VLSLAFAPDGRRLVSGAIDTTALVWDVSRLVQRRAAPVALSASGLESCWKDLRGDAATAYGALGALVASPAQAVPLLRDRLQPATASDERRIARLISDLDSEQFAARRKAAADLEELGQLAEPALQKALRGKPSTEARRALQALLDKLAEGILPLDRVREIRAVEVLEHVGTAEAREVLEKMTRGVQGTRLTRQAETALERVARRRTHAP